MRRRHARARAVLASLLFVLLAGCNEVELHSGLTESSAQDIIVVLRNAGIKATKVVQASGQDRSWTIMVSSGNASEAWQLLVENELPRIEPKGFASFFGQAKLIPTETEEKAIFLQALCGELAQTIEAMPNVIDARVHISVPERDPLRQVIEGQPTPEATAAVMVKYWKRSENMPPEETINAQDIQRIVASSVERLDERNVKVVIKAKTPTTPRTASAGGADPAAFFLPLAGAAGLLLLLLIVMVLRVRSLSKQISGLRRAPQGKAPEPEKT